MTPTLTLAQLEKMRPCPESFLPARKLLRTYRNGEDTPYSVADARAAGVPLANVLWAIDAMNADRSLNRKVRLFLCDCAARVLRIFEDRFPDDDRPRKCIEFYRKNPDGAAGAVWTAGAAGAAEAARAAWAAGAAWAAEAAGAAEAASAAGAVWAAGAAGEEWQYERLELWFSDNEPEPWPLPEKPAPPQ